MARPSNSPLPLKFINMCLSVSPWTLLVSTIIQPKNIHKLPNS